MEKQNMIFQVLDNSFYTRYTIHDYVEAIIDENYYGHNTMSLTLPYDPFLVRLLLDFKRYSNDFYFVVPLERNEYYSQFYNGYIIKRMEVVLNRDEKVIRLECISLSSLLDDRVIRSPKTVTDKLDKCMIELVNSQTTDSTTYRKYPNFIMQESWSSNARLNQTVTVSKTDIAVSDSLFELCEMYDVSFDVFYDNINKKFVYRNFSGSDQSNNVKILADTDMIVGMEIVLDKTDYKNFVYAKGTWTDDKSVYGQTFVTDTSLTTTEPSGFSRKETLIESSLSTSWENPDGSSGSFPDKFSYVSALGYTTTDEVNNYYFESSFSGTLVLDNLDSSTYGKIKLGNDITLFSEELNLSRKVQIVKKIRTYTREGLRTQVVLDKDKISYNNKILNQAKQLSKKYRKLIKARPYIS